MEDKKEKKNLKSVTEYEVIRNNSDSTFSSNKRIKSGQAYNTLGSRDALGHLIVKRN